MVAKLMQDHMFLGDQNKLLQQINFKNILMIQKLKFRKIEFPGFLEYQEFQRLHHKLSPSQTHKLRKMNSQKISLSTQTEMKMRTLAQQPPQLSKLFHRFLHIKQRIFFKMNTNYFWRNMKISCKQIKQWKKK